MAGRNKQPLAVIQGKGKSKHLTKEEINSRQRHEEQIRGSTDNIVVPTYLTVTQKKEFNQLVIELMKLEIFSNLDVDSLARYLDSKYQYLQLVRDMKKIKPTETVETEQGKRVTIANDDYPKLLRAKNMLFTECRQAAADLGLTISSRLKLVIPQVEEKEKSEFERKFGDV